MGRDGPSHPVRAVAVFHRLPQAGWAFRHLGGGLPVVTDQPECTQQARPTRHCNVVCAGRASALCAHHHVALRSGEPAVAWHAQGCQRGCGAPRPGNDWRSQRPALAVEPSGQDLYGHQEGAEGGYNPHKPGRPSHAYHTDVLSSLRLVLRVDVLPGDEYNVADATDGLWALLDHLGPSRWPALLRGDKSWGIERVMARAEQNDLPYLFRLRMTANVKRSLERAMQQSDWADAGQGWQGKETSLRLSGWSRHRRIVLL